ncbi:MAG: GH3 auxin-responsive promoter family protein [Acetobacteraceae bacterium]|nr:GH3 auxin-responsive promoter family protein [Acetobacteraceae bacterium]
MIDATPLLRAYASWRGTQLDRQDPASVQERLLLRLVRHAARTEFGQAHGFAGIRSVADFQGQVALRKYENFWRDWWQPRFPILENVTWPGRIPFLALSSGTTSGATKYIPVSRAMIRANRRAALDTLVHHYRNRPATRILAGCNFLLGGSTDLKREAPGVYSGDLSGIAAVRVPLWARPWYFPLPNLALIADWERKIDLIARASLRTPITALSGTPSWLLVLFERLAGLRPASPRRLVSFYPRLELLVHGGVNFAPYQARFAEWLEASHAELREVYPASEGFIAIADRAPREGMRIILDNGLFYEFVPVAELDADHPPRYWIANAEPGADYALVLSTCAGLWAYVLGDVVRVLDRNPPRLLVVGRTSYFLSAYGEHLTGEEIEGAVLEAATTMRVSVVEFSVGPEPGEGARGRHVFVIELEPGHSVLSAAFAQALDARLCQLNEDYRAHRRGGQMDLPRMVLARAGLFTDWMRARGRLGGQNKVPRVINDTALLESLLDFATASHK